MAIPTRGHERNARAGRSVRVTDGAAAGQAWSAGPTDSRGIGIAQVPDAVFATDLENRITHWAKSAVHLFGYTAAEAIGRQFTDLLPSVMAAPEGEADLLEAIRAGRTWRGRGTVRLRDGTELWIESTVNPTIVRRRVVGSVSVSRDMTAAHEAQRQAATQQQFLDAVLEAAGSLVIVVDVDGRIVRFNRACERLTGYDSAEVEGRRFWDVLVAPNRVAVARAAFRSQLRSLTPAEVRESRWLTRSGAERIVAWSFASLTDENGAVTHVVGTGTDVTDERRAEDALRGIEAVGQLLATSGPTQPALEAVLHGLSRTMGYRYLALVLRDGAGLRVGAQLGYVGAPDRFDSERGVIGRVLATGDPALVDDVRLDGDYIAGAADVRSEICVPLSADRRIVGALNIESTEAFPLTGRDLRLAQAVADRLSTALLLGREQEALTERARLFAALSEFARVANSIRDLDRLWSALATAIDEVVTADESIVVGLDRPTGTYLIRAVRGVDEAAVGTAIQPGSGTAGRAILQRMTVMREDVAREDFAGRLGEFVPFQALSILAVPFIWEGEVLGAISVGRVPTRPVFSDLEREVMTLLGTQAALAVANAHLLEEVSELAVHDGLTGLYNRRHFDASLELILARWLRDRDRTRRLVAILFDLDHFGRVNKEHGHQAGDIVLREFAGILRGRFRASDLVARYGGEEFVAILEGSGVEDAVKVADEVRVELASRTICGPEGEDLRATVSAGCTSLDPEDPSRQALLRSADAALFRAKRTGRNRVCGSA